MTMGVGSQIRMARGMQGLTQAELAAKAGVSRPTVARVELGVAISFATLVKIADALGLDITLVAKQR